MIRIRTSIIKFNINKSIIEGIEYLHVHTYVHDINIMKSTKCKWHKIIQGIYAQKLYQWLNLDNFPFKEQTNFFLYKIKFNWITFCVITNAIYPLMLATCCSQRRHTPQGLGSQAGLGHGARDSSCVQLLPHQHQHTSATRCVQLVVMLIISGNIHYNINVPFVYGNWIPW